MGRVISDEAGWPNAHFLTADPLDVAMFHPAGDGADDLVLMVAISKKFPRAPRLYRVGLTLGELVDQLLEAK